MCDENPTKRFKIGATTVAIVFTGLFTWFTAVTIVGHLEAEKKIAAYGKAYEYYQVNCTDTDGDKFIFYKNGSR